MKRGFTLIELLVVVAIIGVLATIVMSSVTSLREKARVSNLTQELHQLQTALEVYYVDNGHYPPLDDDPGDQAFIGGSLNLSNPTYFAYFNSHMEEYIDLSFLVNYNYQDIGILSFVYLPNNHPYCTPDSNSRGQTYSFFFFSYDGIIEDYYTGVQDSSGRYRHCLQPQYIIQ